MFSVFALSAASLRKGKLFLHYFVDARWLRSLAWGKTTCLTMPTHFDNYGASLDEDAHDMIWWVRIEDGHLDPKDDTGPPKVQLTD